MPDETIFSGEGGYASLVKTSHKGQDGALLKISNPNSRVNTVPSEALAEIAQALDVVEADKALRFLVLYGEEGRIHAGADVNMFAGGLTANENPPDYQAVHAYLEQGAGMDLRIKRLSKERITVSAVQGERFGGSVEWPLMTTHCVAAPDSGIQFSEVNIGIIPGWDGILNVLLKSGTANALYMGTTGARLNADDMKEAGLVAALAEPEQLLAAALDLAVDPPPVPDKAALKRLAGEETLLKTLSERLNVRRYEALVEEVKAKQDELEPKEFARHIDARLAEMGRPVAPLAVEAVFGLVAKGALLEAGDLDAVEELAEDEVASCSNLMKTRDRVVGINSVLKARENPLSKIAIFDRS